MRVLGSLVSGVVFIVAGPALALSIGVGGTNISIGGGGASVSTSVGGTSASVSSGSGGTSASVSSGGTSVGGSVGGDGGTYASVGGSTGGTGASVGITDNSGSLIGVQQADGSTAATVNLGSALNGFLTDPGPRTINLNNALNGVGPLNSPAERVRGAFLSLSYAQRRQVRRTCVEVFAHPGSFDRDTRILCSLIARL